MKSFHHCSLQVTHLNEIPFSNMGSKELRRPLATVLHSVRERMEAWDHAFDHFGGNQGAAA